MYQRAAIEWHQLLSNERADRFSVHVRVRCVMHLLHSGVSGTLCIPHLTADPHRRAHAQFVRISVYVCTCFSFFIVQICIIINSLEVKITLLLFLSSGVVFVIICILWFCVFLLTSFPLHFLKFTSCNTKWSTRNQTNQPGFLSEVEWMKLSTSVFLQWQYTVLLWDNTSLKLTTGAQVCS